MKLLSLQLQNFRNYQNLNLEQLSSWNIFFGRNAQGKTGILEGIYYLSLLTSYRTHNDWELLQHETTEFILGCSYRNTFRTGRLRVSRDSVNKKRSCESGGLSLSAKEYIGELKVVAFSPDDLSLLKGDPSVRRRFLNIQISRLNKYYYELLVKFNLIIKQRNKLLREIRDGKLQPGHLLAWDEEYVRIASEITRLRREFLQEFIPLLCEFYCKLAQDTCELLNFEYKTNFSPADQVDKYPYLLQLMQENCEVDIRRGSTGLGPHKDDFNFYLASHDAQKFASQGQQRSIVLALKLAEVAYIYQQSNEYPLLLLDDVLSELDEVRQSKLLEYVPADVQVFITLTERKLLPAKIFEQNSVCCYQVEAGRVELVV